MRIPDQLSSKYVVILVDLYRATRDSGADIFMDMKKSMGPTSGKKLQLHLTDLSYSTVLMWWKELGRLVGDGFVQCGGVFQAFGLSFELVFRHVQLTV